MGAGGMMQERFETLLKQSMGLDVKSVGPSTIMRAVESRVRLSGAKTVEHYWDRLEGNPAELQALIEAVLIPETWFFRDPEAFNAAAALIQAKRFGSAAPSRAPWQARVLSLPCSTGEEPYSIAMALIDAGTPPQAVHIDGMDISNASLTRAREGVYGRNSFRGANIAYRARHFTDSGKGHRISDTVRSMVQFSQGNLFELDHLPDASFDVIFCRNLLIYFDPDDQDRAAKVLHRLLSPSGALFVGHSEASVLLGHGFSSLRIPRAFAFQKRDVAEAPPRETPPARRRPAKPSPPPTRRDGAAMRAPLRRPFARASAPPAPRPSLDDIKRAADRGELQVALQLGRDMLDDGPQSTDALYLLAVINEAAGALDAAADLYRKTLYLEPDHHEALSHLALLQRRIGDLAGAERTGERARRLSGRRTGQ